MSGLRSGFFASPKVGQVTGFTAASAAAAAASLATVGFPHAGFVGSSRVPPSLLRFPASAPSPDAPDPSLPTPPPPAFPRLRPSPALDARLCVSFASFPLAPSLVWLALPPLTTLAHALMFADPRPSSSRHLSSSSSSRSSVFPSSALARSCRVARGARLLARRALAPAKPSNRPPRDAFALSARARVVTARHRRADRALTFPRSPPARVASRRRRVAASRVARARPRARARKVVVRRRRRVAPSRSRASPSRVARRALEFYSHLFRAASRAATSRSTAVARDVTTRRVDGVAGGVPSVGCFPKPY